MRARVPTLKTDIFHTDIPMVQRENSKPPPLLVTGKGGRLVFPVR